MPPAVIAAGVAAAGTIGGAAISARGQGKATDASLAANREALDYRREQDERAEEAYKVAWENYVARQQALMRHLGIEFDPAEMPDGPPGAVPRTGGPEGPQMVAGGPRGAPGVPGGQSPRTLGELGDWNDWRKLGLRS